MQLISGVSIQSFRSLSGAHLDGLGHFTALAGLNNAGKSNVLRALNPFFTGRTDGDKLLSVDQDYFRPHLTKKKAIGLLSFLQWPSPAPAIQPSAAGCKLPGGLYEIKRENGAGVIKLDLFFLGVGETSHRQSR